MHIDDDSFCSIFGVLKKIKSSFANKSDQAEPKEEGVSVDHLRTQPLTAADEAVMETREASPAHFLIEIDSFSLLEKRAISKVDTMEFTSGKYNWRLVIYPNGHGTGIDDEGYVSVYLAITNTTALPSNWEVNATFSICLFNHVSDKYCYSLGRAQRFHSLKQEWGFKKFISKKNLTDPSNGYLVDDKCVFGAEVVVNENMAVTQCLSAKSIGKDPYKREFKISNFSELKERWVSEVFTVGDNKWVIQVYPNGNGKESGLCIYLRHVVYEHCSNSQRVRTWFTIRIKGQYSSDIEHYETSSHTFSGSKSEGWGWYSFIKLSTLNDPNKGFIVKDCFLIEIEMAVQAISS